MSAADKHLNTQAPASTATLVFLAQEPDKSEGLALARELGLPLVTEVDQSHDLVLAWAGARLELRDRRNPRLKPLCLDFTQVPALQQRRAIFGRQPLARAIGKLQTVADATAGLGQDSLRLASMGYRVIAIERCVPVAALLRDGLRRLHREPNPLSERVQLLIGDARTLLTTLAPAPQAVYLDPMFPPKRRRSAAVRKELNWLRDLAGHDDDALELFACAHRVAIERVVVKRPNHAPPLAPKPAASIPGKLVRYDIYSARVRYV